MSDIHGHDVKSIDEEDGVIAECSIRLRETLERDGFVIIPQTLSETRLEELRQISHHAADLARSGKWRFVRNLPKQFPPWSEDNSEGIWGVQHLLHPDMPNHDKFATSYFNKVITTSVKALTGVDKDEDLVMELYNLLIRPDSDFTLRWHRDDIASSATAEEELERLNKPAWHAQWNLALYNDSSLMVVPKSHTRARTEVEIHAGLFSKPIPGQCVVGLKPGDLVFYNNNILHRGVYNSFKERLTLHGSIGCMSGSKERARNVLQHGVRDWIDRCDFSRLPTEMKSRAEKMRANLKQMGCMAGEVGFAHED
jgi:Phytanoyl-CoA dioxygenase (PhyH)